MNITENKSFCTMLWNNVSADPAGNIKPCCISRDIIKKPDGTPYNLGRDKIVDFYNSPDYVEIRRKMLAGETVPGCSQCTQIESYGKQSKRIITNRNWPRVTIQTKTVVEPKIEYFDLRFGNLCNLKCRSCMPLNSSQLDSQVKEYPELKQFYRESGFNINDWYETDIFDENLLSNLSHIKFLYITGGEPSLIKKNFELLEKLIATGYSKNISLMINSNLTNDKTYFFDLLSEFKNTMFLASIDGHGKTQEYLRYPSDWNQIDKNIQKLVNRNADNINLHVSPVVQIGNLNTIVDLFEYCEAFNRNAGKLVIDIFINVLENPSYLNIINLPLDYKIQCWNKIDEWVKTSCKYQNKLFYEQIETIKNKCFADVDYQKELKTFFEFNQLLDNIQKTDLKILNPELHSLMHK